MIARLVLLFVLVVGLVLAVHWFTRADPKKVAQALRRGLPWLAAALLLGLAVVGRQWLLALAALILPLLDRALALLRYVPILSQLLTWLQNARATTVGAPGAAGVSQVKTRFLHMTLSHATGEMDGEILAGRYRGRRLGALKLPQLLELLNDYQTADADSAALLTAYLDRVYGTEWRDDVRAGASSSADAPARGGMSVEEARAVLGVAEDATREEVIAAHRRLMQKLHPDRGGSDYLAAKLNQAKDVLLQGGNDR